MGLFAVAHERGLVSPDYAVFNCIDDISQAYFLALFRNSAIRGVFLTESKGLGTGSSGFLRLYSDRFGGIKVPCPPREEQEKIVLAINDHFLKFADGICVPDQPSLEFSQDLGHTQELYRMGDTLKLMPDAQKINVFTADMEHSLIKDVICYEEA